MSAFRKIAEAPMTNNDTDDDTQIQLRTMAE